jgi:hypothetical protein
MLCCGAGPLVWSWFVESSSFDQVRNARALPRLSGSCSSRISCSRLAVALYLVYFARGTGQLVIGNDQPEASSLGLAIYGGYLLCSV